MKKILIVNASKRRRGNSYALEARIAEQLQGKAEVVTFNIGEKDVRACLACASCPSYHGELYSSVACSTFHEFSCSARLAVAGSRAVGPLFVPKIKSDCNKNISGFSIIR